MRLFLLRILRFLFILFIIVLLSHLGAYSYNRFNNHEPAELYVFGDSQMYRALKINKSNQQYKVLSAAKHGAGIYDFLNFTRRVPENSVVILPLPKLILLRDLALDRNDSGLVFYNIYLMFEHGYSLNELVRIAFINLFPKHKWFSKMHDTYPCESSLVPNEFEIFERLFAQLPDNFFKKRDLFLEGIAALKKKNVTINFVELPFHDEMKELIDSEVLTQMNENMILILNESMNNFSTQKLYIDSSEEIFRDWTHLNDCGADLVTKFIFSNLSMNSPSFFRIASQDL